MDVQLGGGAAPQGGAARRRRLGTARSVTARAVTERAVQNRRRLAAPLCGAVGSSKLVFALIIFSFCFSRGCRCCWARCRCVWATWRFRRRCRRLLSFRRRWQSEDFGGGFRGAAGVAPGSGGLAGDSGGAVDVGAVCRDGVAGGLGGGVRAANKGGVGSGCLHLRLRLMVRLLVVAVALGLWRRCCLRWWRRLWWN